MNKTIDIASMRREYGDSKLTRAGLASDPLEQFQTWLQDALDAEGIEASAMTLATVGTDGYPETRTVLLKGVEAQGLLFFTHYSSKKAQDIAEQKHVALNFYWPSLARQVRIKGIASQCSRQRSDAYFASRPRASQIATAASPQSSVLDDEEHIDRLVSAAMQRYQDSEVVPCPESWGGYWVTPHYFEFMQGRDSRLNDRFCYQAQAGAWHIHKLAP